MKLLKPFLIIPLILFMLVLLHAQKQVTVKDTTKNVLPSNQRIVNGTEGFAQRIQFAAKMNFTD